MGHPPTLNSTAREPQQSRAPFRRFVLAACIAVAILGVLPADLHGAWLAAFGTGALIAVGVRSRSLPSRVRGPVRLLVLAASVSVTAGIVRGLHGAATGTDYPFPSVADGLYLVNYLLFLAAILIVVKRRVGTISVDAAIDAIIGAIAAGLVQWSVVLLPYLQTVGITTLEKVANLTFSTLTLAMVAAAILLLVAGSTPSASNRLLALGLIATFATDISAVLVSAGSLPTSAEVYPAFMILVFGPAGVFHPSVIHLVDPPSGERLRARLTRRRVSVLGLALLCPPVLMLVAAVTATSTVNLTLPAVASLALTPLVIARLARLVKQNEALASLEAALRTVSERLVGAESVEDVTRFVTVGAEQILGDRLAYGGLIIDPLVAAASGPPEEVRAQLARLEAHVDGGGRIATAALVDVSAVGDEGPSIAGMVVVQRTLRAALLLRVRAKLSQAEYNAVETLCREADMALRAVEQTELQVRERSEARFGALVDNSSDIVTVLNSDLRPDYVSPVASRLLGYPDLRMDRADVLSIVHPADRHVAQQLIEDVRFGLRNTVELRVRRHDGSYIWFEIVGADLTSDPDIAGIVLNLREIEDRKRAEEQLVHSEARFKALVQNSADLLLVVDEGCVIRYASPSVEDVVGEESEAVLGRPLDQLFLNSNVNWSHQLRALCHESDPHSDLFEFRFIDRSDQQHTIETSVRDLRSEPAVGGFVLNARDVTERTRMEHQLEYQATHDELTGLGNRVRVLSDLNEILARNSGSTTVAAILVGLDDFKDINDSLGHAAGDQLLIAVSERIISLLGFGDVAARVGGDTFAVVVERARGETQISELAEQLLSAIATPFEIDGRELSVTASAGIEFDHDRSRTSEILLRNADIAMFRAKHEGKRRVVVFEPHMHTASFDRLELRADLARAVAADQFVAHYQPVVEIGTGRFIGAEALIRWEHPERGLLGPGLFIPLAEETGLIGPIGQWILDRACADLAKWRRLYGEAVDDFTISVNLAVEQLIDESIVSSVRDILARHGLPASKLVLEVTESTLITDTEKIRHTMQKLRALGTRLAIDDFGTGYSSLGYIQQFEFDILKIDKSFVDALDSFTNQRIVTAVIELAQQLGVRTIAEGIETQLQADLLGDLQCVFGQGYLYSRPVPERELSELLLRISSDHAATR